VLVGFAVETDADEQVVALARGKLEKKRADVIVANHADDAFGRDDNRIPDDMREHDPRAVWYAVAVAVRGPASAPTLVARRIVELCDPAVAQTRQPYHAALHAHEPDPRVLGRRIAIVTRCANQSIAALLNTDVFADSDCGGAAVVVGSLIDPATVANPHIRAHASETAGAPYFRGNPQNA